METDFDWQEQWENGSDQEYGIYAKMTDQELITALKKLDLGLYNRIWQVIDERKNPDFVTGLFECLKKLKGNELLLERQHCAEILFKKLKYRNMLLIRALVGQSDSFDEQQFKKSLKTLSEIIAYR